MATNLQALQQRIRFLEQEAVYLSGRDHEPSDFADLLTNAGTWLERFLKAHIHPRGHNWKFVRLINELASIGVAAPAVASLHLVRRRYNSAKHDPAYEPSIDDVTGALGGLLVVLHGLAGRAFGTSEQEVAPAYRRRVWLASWDHYVHGDGEVHVMLPVGESDCDLPPSIDTIYLKGLAWPDVLKPLGASVRPAQGVVPQRFLDAWEREGDFAGARVFEGAYRDLLRVLAGAELGLDLLPFLKRENDRMAMLIAVAFASVDTVRSQGPFDSIKHMSDEIKAHAAREYAAPRASPLVVQAVARFSVLLNAVPPERFPQVAGPRFLPHAKFNQAVRTAVAHDGDVAVTREFEVVVRI